jgi:hypothetical protein
MHGFDKDFFLRPVYGSVRESKSHRARKNRRPVRMTSREGCL